MAATLVSPRGRTALAAAQLTIGRAPDNTLALDDPIASAHHAAIQPDGPSFRVVDLGSRNGTFVNEQQVASGTSRLLQPGDRIRVGQTQLVFEMQDTPQSPSNLNGSTVRAYPPRSAPTAASNAGSITNYDMDNLFVQFGAPAAPPLPVSEVQLPAYVQPAFIPNPQPAYMPGSSTPPPISIPPQPPQRKRRRVLWLVSGALVIVLLAAAVIVVFLFILPSTPDKTLNAFCSDIQNRDYQNAYELTSLHFQSTESESGFQQGLSYVISCSHTVAAGSNSTSSATVAFEPTSTYKWGYLAALIKDGSGNWKINHFEALPDVTLDEFCTDIQNGDFTGAYSLTTTWYQNAIPESQFASTLNSVKSCTHDQASASSGGVTSTITYQDDDGSSTRQDTTLVMNNNGDWKIDTFQSRSPVS